MLCDEGRNEKSGETRQSRCQLGEEKTDEGHDVDGNGGII